MHHPSILGLCLALGWVPFIQGTLTPTTTYDHDMALIANDVYHLRWSFTDTEITFEVQVQTTGYVGFGLSPAGSMAGADIVLGAVDGDAVTFNVSFWLITIGYNYENID